jgi:hypothetical protein
MKVQVALNLQGSNNAQVLVDADNYVTNMTNNPNFSAPEIVAQVAVTKTSSASLRTVMAAPTSDTKTDDIRIARDVLDRNVTKLARQVEDVANDPSTPDANRVDIVHSAGMNVKSQVRPQRHKFTASNADVSGTVILTAQGGANAHEWQYTNDLTNFTGKIAATSTTTAHTEVSGLKKATEYAFFHKAIIAGVKTDWEGPVFLTVT